MDINPAVQSQLLQGLRDRREIIADLWYQAIARTSFTALMEHEARAALLALTEQTVTALLAEPFQRQQAQAIGAALAHLRYLQPEALGRTQAVLGLQFFEGLSPEDSTVLQPRLITLLGEIGTGFFRQARTMILDEQEEIRGALFVARSQAEAELQASEERFRSAFDYATTGMALVALDGRYLQVNRSLCNILGYTEHELLQTTFTAITNCDDVSTSLVYAQQLLNREISAYQIEKRYIHKLGHTVWVLLAVSLARDGTGKPLYFIAQIQDITERRRAAEALEQERRQLRNIIDSAPVAMAMFDRDMKYIAHSRQWLDDYGLEGQALIGRSNVEVLPDIPERWKAIYIRALQGETFTHPEDIWERANGDVIYVRWAVRPWYLSDSMAGGVVVATHRVNELVEAREAALEASRLKSEFIATVSHEIRTPMNSIIGMTELLMRTRLADDQYEFAGIVRDSAHALLAIINDILDFSKIEAGTFSLDIQDFTVRALIESTVESLRAKAHEKQIALKINVDPEVPLCLRGDPGRLRQVLLNLGDNAVKFTHQGEVLVSATVEALSADRVTVRFSVSDTGIGIAEGARVRIFQPFTQVDGSSTRKYGGTGLGLAISKRFVELMRGSIGVESVSGRGSTFWFSIPLEQSLLSLPKMPGDTEPALVASAVVAGAALAEEPVVLVAEDDPSSRKLVLLQLESLGYSADAVSTGRDALTVTAAKSYSLILMDIHMPDLDGFAATAAIRDQERAASADPENPRRLPIIAMTAAAMPGDQEACLAAGMDDYLSKPADLEHLRRIIERWIPFPTSTHDAHVTTDGPPGLISSVQERLRQLQRGTKQEHVAELIDIFLTEMPRMFSALRMAIEEADAAMLQLTAHRLKGSSANVGAHVLSGLCEQLEQLGGAATTTDAGAWLRQIETELARVMTTLEWERQYTMAAR